MVAQLQCDSKSRRSRALDTPRVDEIVALRNPFQRPIWFPLLFNLCLGLTSLAPRVQTNTVLLWSFWLAVLVLTVWQIVLWWGSRRKSHWGLLSLELRPQHYLQAALQFAVFAYWGYYWRPVYDQAWLLLAQVAFAYSFDMLLCWSRRANYRLGFGPFPIVFSTNLFLWFRDDWFYLQFVMIAIGFMGKEFVRWRRDGQWVHMFNPSAFSLSLFSLVLIVTGTSELTWGVDIATTLSLAPRIYLFLFLIGLVVMYCFSVTLIAGTAAMALFGFSALYSGITGIPYFLDAEIPTAVFLGLHLLVTDPSTSPKSLLGKSFFGLLYGVGVFVLYALLGSFGFPTFYDKLLCVPLLNLSVRWIDRVVHWIQTESFLRHIPVRLMTMSNLVHMSVWMFFFLIMTIIGSTDGMHRGDTLPFWQQACKEGRLGACNRLIQVESSYCGDNSGWACNELGRHYISGDFTEKSYELASGFFSRACELRFQAGCLNLLQPALTVSQDPRPIDLRLLLREGGPNLMETSESELYLRACKHGWTFACNKEVSDSRPVMQ